MDKSRPTDPATNSKGHTMLVRTVCDWYPYHQGMNLKLIPRNVHSRLFWLTNEDNLFYSFVCNFFLLGTAYTWTCTHGRQPHFEVVHKNLLNIISIYFRSEKQNKVSIRAKIPRPPLKFLVASSLHISIWTWYNQQIHSFLVSDCA